MFHRAAFCLGSTYAIHRSRQEARCAIQAETLSQKDILDSPESNSDALAPRFVVVGGGFSGSKLAYLLDSIFNVTFIDTKNFFEHTPDVITFVGSPWTEATEEACNRLMTLHRFYLKRANVVTAKVVEITEKEVVLQDGKRVPYDALALTLGEKKPYPFSSDARTKTQRIQELKELSNFVQHHCKKIAVVGGGPMGVSLTKQLSESYPEKEIHLYHSSENLAPSLPKGAQHYAYEDLSKQSNVTLQLERRVVDTKMQKIKGSEFPTFSVIHQQEHGRAKRNARSILYHCLFGTSGTHLTLKTQQRQIRVPVVTGEQVVDSGYDYVFLCTGSVPRTLNFSTQPFHKEHLTDTGHYRVSKYLQLFDHPNVFAVGRCNNLPWVKSYGNSEVQVAMLLRLFVQAVTKDKPRTFDKTEGIKLHKMLLPRVLVPYGNSAAFGSTAWDGATTGGSAWREMVSARKQHTQSFVQPIFYKSHDGKRIAEHFREWLSKERMDVADFDIYNKQ